MNDWITTFVEHKARVARCLNGGHCDGTYAEAAIVLCSVFSALAAQVWPGKDRIDRKRFTELLARHTARDIGLRRISTPILCEILANQGNAALGGIADSLRQTRLPSIDAQIVTGDDVDDYEDSILAEHPALSKALVRKASYACLLYEDIRCGLLHEYSSLRATGMPMTQRPAGVSYANLLKDDDTTEKLVHFHFPWLEKIADALASNLVKAPHLPLPRPSAWWIDGEP